MIIKRIVGRYGAKRHKKCLKCNAVIQGRLKDDVDYICPVCGQIHLVDVYDKFIHLTAAERPEERKRHKGTEEHDQISRSRRKAIEYAEELRKKRNGR
ncbi:hypothetical protein [uncultured Robinsoniella sp.]|uniref:hypothetical protein n=1 Tax=uncultured Robinsoniella sp. TaxID=904190 RepID=UPI00290E8FDC|nr:hypothetical protein [Clostridiales bacterium]